MNSLFKSFSNSSQLMGMIEASGYKRALVALPPEAGLANAFKECADEIQIWHHDFSVAQLEYKNDKAFSLMPPDGPFDLVFFHLPKARDYQTLCLNWLLPSLTPSARLIVVGPKDGGAASAKNLLEPLFDIQRKHAARHCIAWDCTWNPKEDVPKDRRFQAQNFEVEAWNTKAEVHTLPGVFNHGSLDKGTRMFLDSAPIPGPKDLKILDWACGSGVLGALAALANPKAKVTFADVSSMALESCRRTLEANKLEGHDIIASDGFASLPDKYNLILTNPPAHKGLRSDRSATEKFLTKAVDHLLPHGRLILVANGHLPYMSILTEIYKNTAVLSKNSRFQVIEVEV